LNIEGLKNEYKFELENRSLQIQTSFNNPSALNIKNINNETTKNTMSAAASNDKSSYSYENNSEKTMKYTYSIKRNLINSSSLDQ